MATFGFTCYATYYPNLRVSREDSRRVREKIKLIDMSTKALQKKVKQIKHPKKVEFLKLYSQLNGHISDTCKGIGIDRGTYYHWLDQDEVFRNAVVETELNLNDDIRRELIKKAKDDKDLGAIIFYLKNRHPDFKPQPQTVAVQVNNYQEVVDKINDN